MDSWLQKRASDPQRQSNRQMQATMQMLEIELQVLRKGSQCSQQPSHLSGPKLAFFKLP